MQPGLLPGIYSRGTGGATELVESAVFKGGENVPPLCEPGSFKTPPQKILGLSQTTFIIVCVVVAVAILLLVVLGFVRKDPRPRTRSYR
mmetsp:Transcript_16340/g.33253  ORF Transcript_16340/g.33253 Transcript_16340/m.33253 type:complete len:89 (+) Transcript_16340:4979-5245(+)